MEKKTFYELSPAELAQVTGGDGGGHRKRRRKHRRRRKHGHKDD